MEIPNFFIDWSALKGMFAGEGSGGELLKKIKDMKNKGIDIKVTTTLSNFLRAIWLSNPEIKIQDIQKTMSFLEIGFSMADFKNEKDVLEETLRIVQAMQGGKNG
jgi:hypothetical protein